MEFENRSQPSWRGMGRPSSGDRGTWVGRAWGPGPGPGPGAQAQSRGPGARNGAGARDGEGTGRRRGRDGGGDRTAAGPGRRESLLHDGELAVSELLSVLPAVLDLPLDQLHDGGAEIDSLEP